MYQYCKEMPRAQINDSKGLKRREEGEGMGGLEHEILFLGDCVLLLIAVHCDKASRREADCNGKELMEG